MLKEPDRKYVSLDNFDDRDLAKNNPALFIQKYEPPVIIDEVEYAPELFTYIKIYVDWGFWLTGSQKYELMKGIQESLAGRVLILDMLGLSYKEIIKKPYESKPFLPRMDMMSLKSKPKKLMYIGKIFSLGTMTLVVGRFYNLYIAEVLYGKFYS
jgi:predicted AAA+ superfamily ATPase